LRYHKGRPVTNSPGRLEFAAISVEKSAAMRFSPTSAGRGGLFIFALGLSLAAYDATAPVHAQLFNLPPLRPPADVPSVPPPPAQDILSPPPSRSAPAPRAPALQSLPPPSRPGVSRTPKTVARSSDAPLALTARYGADLPQITHGLHWRIYPLKTERVGALRPVGEDRNAAPVFSLPPGDYVVHVGFGLASATRTVQLGPEGAREAFEIPAGGLRIQGRVGDARIPRGQITFDLFRGSQFDPGSQRPVVSSVMAGDVILVPEGGYHIVSNYGDGNSVVRSDIRVQVGKLTDATVTHRAAIITLKLVDQHGGEARANTQWSVLTPGGDVVKESIGAFPRVILAEGDYRAIARYDDKTYERTFRVVTGVDTEVEVLAR
jgi:hypothetical protein